MKLEPRPHITVVTRMARPEPAAKSREKTGSRTRMKTVKIARRVTFKREDQEGIFEP